MPAPKQNKDAVAAAQAITADMGVLRSMSYLNSTARIAAIIDKKMAQAIERAFREGCEECNCPACRRNFDHAWKHSDARAALAQEVQK